MPTERMRRVNEVMREVIGSAIATELEDPRIGFVTVTSVETSPDLRSARVYVSVLGGEAEREATLAGLSSSHGVLQAAIARQMRTEAHPDPDLPLRRDPGARRRASPGCSTSERRSRGGRDAGTLARGDGPGASGRRSLPADDPRGPGRRRARLAAGPAPHPHPARQGLGDVPRREGVPAAGRVPLPAPGGGLPRAAGRRGGPDPGLPRLRKHRPHAGRLPAPRRGARS